MGVFDPIRRLCESHELQFFVVLQRNAQPKQRFWSSSDVLNNLCGNLIYEYATYVDTSLDNSAAFPSQTQEEQFKNEIGDDLWIEKELKKENEFVKRIEEIEEEDSVMLPEEEVEEILSDNGNDLDGDSIQVLEVKETRKTYSKAKPVVCPPLTTPLPPSPPPAEMQPEKTAESNGETPQHIVQPSNVFFSLSPSENSAKGFLDDFDDADVATDSSSLVDNPDPIINPTIWKSYSFGCPLRQTTVDKLFKDKLASHPLYRYPRYLYSENCSVRKLSNFEFTPLLLNILKKGNPYCIPYLKQLCW